jgi:hypothetical protein
LKRPKSFSNKSPLAGRAAAAMIEFEIFSLRLTPPAAG